MKLLDINVFFSTLFARNCNNLHETLLFLMYTVKNYDWVNAVYFYYHFLVPKAPTSLEISKMNDSCANITWSIQQGNGCEESMYTVSIAHH